ncbi:MAG TPA: sugar ABC transporter ATP-binding protein [Gaiellaceae bacterium]|nr:sugar ABC transporter ATP-binding protein [Gaiellaceae bacterium]
MARSSEPLLRLEGVSKAYPGVQALAGVDFEVDTGEVHALLGENGAGKSTLMKVIAGSVTPDSGRMTVGAEEVPFGSPEAARARGVGIVYQELSLVPQLSVAENVYLGRWHGPRGIVDWSALNRAAADPLKRIGFGVDPRRLVRELGMAERQLVEIAKALSSEVRVLLLDEPTSALSDREAHRLFEIISDLTRSGVAVVYVSHRLPEVLEIAQRVTVLRDGRKIDTVAAAEVDEARLARLMVGHELAGELGATAATEGAAEKPVVLRAEGLARPPRLKPVDLELRGGEIVGVFGLVGAGRTRLARTLFGLEPATEGTLEIDGQERTIHSPVAAIESGLGYLGEDRAMGVVPRLPVAANITLGSLDRVSHGPVLNFRRENGVAKRYAEELGIRGSIDRLVGALSGGNQQKTVLARWLCSNARILILDDPTRGIDVGAKDEVFRLVRRLAEEGVAILYLTSEAREARSLGDRVLVMADGRSVGSFAPTATEEEIMSAAGGVVV